VRSEIPERIAVYREDPSRQLQLAGLEPDTPQARMYEKRLTDPAALGYLGLSNVFGGLLILPALAATGLALDKLRWARQAGRGRKPREPGEIPLPLLAAALTLAPAGLAWAGVLLSRSKGAIGAGLAGLLLALPMWIYPDFFRHHRRKLLVASLLALLLIVGGIAAYGLRHHSLPGRSFQVRWEYWQGAVSIVREHPLLGVGPANFGDAYLLHRLPAAAEATKTPHNLLLEAAAQYGLPGGLLFLLLLGWMIVAATRPWPQPQTSQPDELAGDDAAKLGAGALAGWAALLGGAIVLMRAIWIGMATPAVLLMEAILPAGAFVLFFVVAAWAGGAVGRLALGRIGLIAALIGFVLHNLLEYTLWMPATATLCWVAAAACAAPGSAQDRRQTPAFSAQPPGGHAARWLIAAAAGAALLLAGELLWEPVYQRTLALRAAQQAYSLDQIPQAQQWLQAAVQADPLDGSAASVLARLLYGHSPAAVQYARAAFQRQPNSGHAAILARVLRLEEAGQSEALEMARKAVDLDPMDVRTRLGYAEALVAAGQPDEAARQIRIIRQIDDARPADSDLRLTPKELERLDALELLASLPPRSSTRP